MIIIMINFISHIKEIKHSNEAEIKMMENNIKENVENERLRYEQITNQIITQNNIPRYQKINKVIK